MQDVRSTILAQYANSPTICSLIEAFDACIDPTADLDTFLTKIWDVSTANTYGLDVWGKIVGVTRNIQIPVTPTYFGFGEAFTIGTATTGVQPFDEAPMYDGALITQTYSLPDESFRKLIMVKAMANISNCTIPAINSMLRALFNGSGRAYVLDVGNMAMQLVFEFILSPLDRSILNYSGVLPRPAGVLISVLQIDPTTTFGFYGSGLRPFNQGTFTLL